MRASAFNYRQESWNTANVSSLQKKVGILLGLKNFQTRALTETFADNGLNGLVSDDEFTHQLEASNLGIDKDEVERGFQEIPSDQFAGKDDSALFDEIAMLKSGTIGVSALSNGVSEDRFRVGSVGGNGHFQIAFRPGEDDSWWRLAAYASKDEAIGTANDFRRFLIRLNIESEGVHIVEHILLRPLSSDAHEIQLNTSDDASNPVTVTLDDFYPFRISVILPNWTARFKDYAFKRLAEETVQLNCPAHIYPEFYWLDFSAMQEFESRYRRWMDAKVHPDTDLADVDEASKQLILFFYEANRQLREQQGNES